MDDEKIREALKRLKEEEGLSYKYIAKQCDMKIPAMYKFTGEVRSLNDTERNIIKDFLLQHGITIE